MPSFTQPELIPTPDQAQPEPAKYASGPILTIYDHTQNWRPEYDKFELLIKEHAAIERDMESLTRTVEVTRAKLETSKAAIDQQLSVLGKMGVTVNVPPTAAEPAPAVIPPVPVAPGKKPKRNNQARAQFKAWVEKLAVSLRASGKTIKFRNFKEMCERGPKVCDSTGFKFKGMFKDNGLDFRTEGQQVFISAIQPTNETNHVQ